MRKWLEYLKKTYQDAKLRTKIIAAYLVLLVIPMTVTSLIFYWYSTNIVKQQTTAVIANNMRRGAAYLGSTLNEVEELGDVFYENSNLQSVLARRNNTDYDDVQEYEYISGVLRQISKNSKVSSVRLYVPDWKFYANENTMVFPFSEIDNDPAAKELMKQNKIKGWYTSFNVSDGGDKRFLSYVVLIVDLNNISKTIGALRIDVPESDISQSIGDIGAGTLGIIDQNNGIIASYGKDAKGLSKSVFKKGYIEKTDIKALGEQYLLITETVPGSEWLLEFAMPSKAITGGLSNVILFTLLVFFGLFMLSVCGVVFMSKQITARITGLAQRMKAIWVELKNQENADTESITRDEVGLLNQSFELMVESLRRLFKDKYQAQLQMREIRLRLLQAQINPHFLYNVLDQINWMAMRAKVPEISETAANLGRFYRIGLSRGKDVISLDEELQYVRLYIELQKYRLGDAVTFRFITDDSAANCRIIKLVLQPLVENAIAHGIMETDSQTGDILIETVKKNDIINICVKDSAGLLDVDKVRTAFLEENSSSSRGYGLKNVDERLKLFFGTDSGIVYYLDESGWSVFSIRIPASEQKDTEQDDEQAQSADIPTGL
jgi:two-component system sensor histidine kinase YesM